MNRLGREAYERDARWITREPDRDRSYPGRSARPAESGHVDARGTALEKIEEVREVVAEIRDAFPGFRDEKFTQSDPKLPRRDRFLAEVSVRRGPDLVPEGRFPTRTTVFRYGPRRIRAPPRERPAPAVAATRMAAVRWVCRPGETHHDRNGGGPLPPPLR